MSSDLDGAVWRKSSYSGGNGGECVGLAFTKHATGVHDSKNPTGPVLEFVPARLGAVSSHRRNGAAESQGRSVASGACAAPSVSTSTSPSAT